MKVCAQCDKQFSDDTRYCPDCGSELQRSQPRGSQPSRRQRNTSGGGASRSNAPSATPSASNSSGPAPSVPNRKSEQPEDLMGRTFFGEYEVTQQLGEGGMGAVYLASHDTIDQKIALKVLHPESAESDEIVQRFHREAKVISRLSHRHIVNVFIFGRTDNDLLFMAMEHVDGVELREQLDGTPIDELRAIKIIKQVCSALAEAHDMARPIIHRDLKPENILLTEHRDEEDFVKILDFGIAKIKHPEGQQGPQLTQAGIVYGTPEYLSPEQAQAEDLDHRTDIYALGCMLFEMMTGRVPFDAEASVEILKQKVFEDPPRPSEFAPVAPMMEEIIMRAMAQDREDRFDDALEMYDALVARENELQRERELTEDDTYVPGGELTGVHRAVDPSDNPIEAVQEQAEAAQEAVVGSEGTAAGGAEADRYETSGTSSTDTQRRNQSTGSNAPAAGGHNRGQRQTPAPGPNNQNRGQPRQSHGSNHGASRPDTGVGTNPGTGASQQGQTGAQQWQGANQQVPQGQQQPQGAASTDSVRYLLIGIVLMLALAVLVLAGYLISVAI